MSSKNTDKFRSTLHRDGSASVWCVYTQQWQRVRELSSSMSATLSTTERERVNAHFSRHSYA
jgi:hypothetical protein